MNIFPLLPPGTKTWENAGYSSTIDLVLTAAELAEEMVACEIHPTDHGSDHRAIWTEFNLGCQKEKQVTDSFSKTHHGQRLEQQWKKSSKGCRGMEMYRLRRIGCLMGVVLGAVDKLVPTAKPSPKLAAVLHMRWGRRGKEQGLKPLPRLEWLPAVIVYQLKTESSPQR